MTTPQGQGGALGWTGFTIYGEWCGIGFLLHHPRTHVKELVTTTPMCKLLPMAGHLEGEQLAITTVIKHVLTGDGPPPSTGGVSKWGGGLPR